MKYIETACIGVNRSNGSQTGVITEGLSVGGTAANFQSDNANFKVAINDNAEAYLKNVCSVSVWSWSDDHSSASVALVCAADGSEHTVDAVITTEEIFSKNLFCRGRQKRFFLLFWNFIILPLCVCFV